MLAAAEALWRPFPFVRADFYSIKGKPVLGELTFTPHACVDTGFTVLAQKCLKELIRLPPKLADLTLGDGRVRTLRP